jgi:hypothetical protein
MNGAVIPFATVNKDCFFEQEQKYRKTILKEVRYGDE